MLPDEDKFSGYVLTTAKSRDFTREAKAYYKEKGVYRAAELAAILKQQGHEAQEIKIGVLDLHKPSQWESRKFKAETLFGRFRAYEFYTEMSYADPVFKNYKGVIVTDCPEPRLRELVRNYATKHKSRERSDIKAYLQAEGYFVEWMEVTLVVTY